MLIEALTNIRYNHQKHAQGSQFECVAKSADQLILAGSAKAVDVVVSEPAPESEIEQPKKPRGRPKKVY